MITSLCLYLAAMPVAYLSPLLSMALIGVVAAIWLLPPKVDAGE